MAYTGERHALYLASSHPRTHMCTRWSLSLCAGEMYEIALEVLPVDRNDRPWPVVRAHASDVSCGLIGCAGVCA